MIPRPAPRAPLLWYAAMDVKEIRHVAELAELSLTDEEAQSLAADIRRIVAFVKELDGVDTTGVPATAQVGAVIPSRSEEGWRADEPLPGLVREDVLAAAPETEADGFLVPAFVES